MIARREILAAVMASAAAAASEASAATDGPVFHVAIFRFAPEHLGEATAAFGAMAAATRGRHGNLAYDVFRGIEDEHEFYIVEHWASAAALAEHERSETFKQLGQGVLTKYATLHDTVTGRPFA